MRAAVGIYNAYNWMRISIMVTKSIWKQHSIGMKEKIFQADSVLNQMLSVLALIYGKISPITI